jgi:hypothetical protein
MENLGQALQEEIENNKYVKRNKVDHLFFLNNYGQASIFLNEILGSEGITPEEFMTLKSIHCKKTNWETRGGHWFSLAYALFHIGAVLKVKKSIVKYFLFIAYPAFALDCSYNFGRILGNFLIMPYNYNKLLNLCEGNSIQSLQTRLFLKRIIYEDILVKEGKKSPVTWKESFVIRKVFGKAQKFFTGTLDYLNRIAIHVKR